MTKVYEVQWFGVTSYIAASTASKAKRRATKSAQTAGYWRSGESMTGMRCRLARCVPTDVTVVEAP
jgi:hypothetical protein